MTPVRRSDRSSGLSVQLGRIVLLMAVVSVFAAPGVGRAEDPSELKQQGYVNDFAGFIGDNESSRIGEVCRTLDEHTGDRVLVVTVNSTGKLTPGQFGEQLRNSWISVTDVRERTLVIVVNGQGRVGFGIGDALEGILTHEKLGAALQGSLAVGGNDYGQKLLYLVQRIAEDIEGAGGHGAGANPSPAIPSGTAPSTPAKTNRSTPSPNRILPYGALLGMMAATLAFRLGRRSWVLVFLWAVLIGGLVYGLFLRLGQMQFFSAEEQRAFGMGILLGVGLVGAGILLTLARRLFARL